MSNKLIFPIAIFLLMLTGCSGQPKSYVVLLEDLDGTTGAINVSNDKGSRTLDKAGYAIGIDNTAAPPGEAFPVPEATLMQTFGATMELTPQRPIIFILYFYPDTSELTPESTEALQKVLPTVTARKVPTIAVTGHTDRVGKEEYNAALAFKRAQQVRDLLIKAGIDAKAIEVSSHGESNPLIPTADEVSEPRNRRVEVIVR